MSPSPLRIAIAIPTYRRPDRLARLLDTLPSRIAEVADAEVVVIVVDNDPEGSAHDVATSPRSAPEVIYAPEPTPGIAAARQHALEAAVGRDLLVFIDDDEVPRERWLSALVECWRRTGASAVAGGVHTIFPADADPWVVASGLFRRPRRSEDERIPAAGAGNLLLDLAVVRESGLRFDTTLGLFGGEDTLFTRQIVVNGGSIVACPASIADDELEPGRATRKFSLARARHHGQTQVVVELRLAPDGRRRLLARARNILKSVAWCTRGLARAAVGVATGSLGRRATGVRQMHRGIGLLQGALGIARPEYGRPTTRSRRSVRAAVADAARRASPFFRSVTAIRTLEPVVVLTLDDGPDPEWTPKILDVLDARGATATFFVLLTRTRTHPELLRRILDAGHEVALHGTDHRNLSTIPRDEVDRILAEGHAELESTTGRPVRWYRPPYGALTVGTWRSVRRAGMTPVLWTTSVLDGGDASHERRIARATDRIGRGAIVLAHDSRAGIHDGVDDPPISPFDRAALIADVLDAYAARGLRTVSLARASERGRLRRRTILVG